MCPTFRLGAVITCLRKKTVSALIYFCVLHDFTGRFLFADLPQNIYGLMHVMYYEHPVPSKSIDDDY
jgi:hypothetical protein